MTNQPPENTESTTPQGETPVTPAAAAPTEPITPELQFEPAQPHHHHHTEGESDSHSHHHHHKHKKKKKLSTPKKVLLIIGIVLLVLILLVAGVFGIYWTRGRNALLSANDTASLTAPDEVVVNDDQTVVYNGETYAYNSNMATILFLGKDSTDTVDDNSGAGQADTVFIVAIDTSTGKTTLLSISRDAMTEVDVYSSSGLYTGIETAQLCTAFSYGDGAEQSCEYMVTAVSRLLYGIPISTYFCIDYSAIPVLTSSIGGVTVPEYDSDWNLTGNTVTLTGKDAITYLQSRSKEDVDANNNRMERQLNYLKAYASKLTALTRSDLSTPLRLYNTIQSYSYNTVDASRITYLATLYLSGGADVTFESVAGEVVMGDELAEFWIDEDALYEQVLSIYYTKVE